MQEERYIFKVIFNDENRNVITLYAEEMTTSLLGFIEISKLFFPEASDIIVTPDDDKVYKIFKDVKRVYIPINQIIRIDELFNNKEPQVINLINKIK